MIEPKIIHEHLIMGVHLNENQHKPKRTPTLKHTK
jgi:hypothetical protein